MTWFHQASWTGANLPAARVCSRAVEPGNAPGHFHVLVLEVLTECSDAPVQDEADSQLQEGVMDVVPAL
ncbi:hypothetical protein, partial [Streptomyces sp. NPDC050388]|uniref:hypothetical protein n=1 Tax=Streptomyces sp. NPDC050388 TaxID=3155781 RepID=UPI0034353CC1